MPEAKPVPLKRPGRVQDFKNQFSNTFITGGAA
jgi:hypothetical protein